MWSIEVIFKYINIVHRNRRSLNWYWHSKRCGCVCVRAYALLPFLIGQYSKQIKNHKWDIYHDCVWLRVYKTQSTRKKCIKPFFLSYFIIINGCSGIYICVCDFICRALLDSIFIQVHVLDYRIWLQQYYNERFIYLSKQSILKSSCFFWGRFLIIFTLSDRDTRLYEL